MFRHFALRTVQYGMILFHRQQTKSRCQSPELGAEGFEDSTSAAMAALEQV
jgi:hypothetical protein